MRMVLSDSFCVSGILYGKASGKRSILLQEKDYTRKMYIRRGRSLTPDSIWNRPRKRPGEPRTESCTCSAGRTRAHLGIRFLSFRMNGLLYRLYSRW